MAWKNVQYENGKMRTSEGGGGSSTFADLEDVDLSNLQDGQVPKYNSSTQKWENANESGGSGHNYSTTEKAVGTWIDGKTIYEKTWDVGSVTLNGSSFTDVTDISASNMETIVNVVGACDTNSGGTISWSGMCAYIPTNAQYVKMLSYRNSGTSTVRYITLQYTKITE